MGGGIVSALYELSRIPLQEPADPDRINEDWSQAHARYHAALVAACDSPWLLRLREILYAQSGALPPAVGAARPPQPRRERRA